MLTLYRLSGRGFAYHSAMAGAANWMIAYNIMVGRKERRCFRARKALMEKRTTRKGTVFGKEPQGKAVL